MHIAMEYSSVNNGKNLMTNNTWQDLQTELITTVSNEYLNINCYHRLNKNYCSNY